MFLPKLLAAAALVAAPFAASTTAEAAAPWSDPVTIPGSAGHAGAGPQVLFTRTRGGVIGFNDVGSIPGAPLLRSSLGAGDAPQTVAGWPNADDFDAGFSAWAAGDRIMYLGPSGRRVEVGIAPGPTYEWRTALRGPETGGARVAATAVSHVGTAGAFATFQNGGGYVYLVRQLGTHAPSASQRVSTKKGSIRSIAVAMNSQGDVLTAWDLHGEIQARFWYGKSKRFGPLQDLGKVRGAMHLTVALGNDRRAVIAWVDQLVSEGNTGQNATVSAVARTAGAGFGSVQRLEQFPDTAIPGGNVIQAKFTSDGRGIVAWSGRTAVRAAFVDGRAFGASQDLAPVAPTDSFNAVGLGDLVVGTNGAAAVTINAPAGGQNDQLVAAPLAPGAAAFGPAEPVSAPAPFLADSSAAFNPLTNQLVVAWRNPDRNANAMLVATRPSP